MNPFNKMVVKLDLCTKYQYLGFNIKIYIISFKNLIQGIIIKFITNYLITIRFFMVF